MSPAPSRPDGTKVTYTIDVEEEMEEVQYMFYMDGPTRSFAKKFF
jgi:hypothetical protein